MILISFRILNCFISYVACHFSYEITLRTILGFPKTSFSVLPTDVITLTGTFTQAVSFSLPESPSPLIYHYHTQRMYTSSLTTWVLHAPIPTVILIIYLLIIAQLHSCWLWSHGKVYKKHTVFVLKLKDSFVGYCHSASRALDVQKTRRITTEPQLS